MEQKFAELPAVNWLVHVLSKTDPDGAEILLTKTQGASSDHKIVCSDEYTKRLILELARLYHQQGDTLYRLHSEIKYQPWHPASELPDGMHSSHQCRTVLVTSPALQYSVGNGVALGYHDLQEGQWYVQLYGRSIKHAVTHWRFLPAAPEPALPYGEIQKEVEELRSAIKEE